MNLYIRYFDRETLVTNVNDAIAFLSSIEEINMNQQIADEVCEYFESDIRFPKRYKVRARVYFIMIKTDAQSMEEFKSHRNASVSKAQTESVDEQRVDNDMIEEPVVRKQRDRDRVMDALNNFLPGWYEGMVSFKRVVTNPVTGKNEYRNCDFVARCKADSGMDCYNRIIEHLRTRVDSRSQFPSVKGRNYRFTYLGETK